MSKNSVLTFSELTKDVAWIKITWNGEVIFDDIDDNETLDDVNRVHQLTKDKKVFSMNVDVVEFHHCILTVEGEPLEDKQQKEDEDDE